MGQGWFIVGVNTDCDGLLDVDQMAALGGLNGKIVSIGPAGSQCDVVDIDGTYAQWMDEICARYFILRPDFYVAATAKTKTELSGHFDEVLSRLGISSRASERSATQ